VFSFIVIDNGENLSMNCPEVPAVPERCIDQDGRNLEAVQEIRRSGHSFRDERSIILESAG